ncbi:MAG: methionine adenosyltransferase [Deltaproteobacteria bacterium]|nr:methionine adenosyltransferase [Deltaproteobacteria bacterium]
MKPTSSVPFANDFLFTSESVTEGHPDKVADLVSDAILDAVLAADPQPGQARVAIETLVKTGLCVIAGELRTTAHIDIPAIARKTITDIGYDSSDKGFDGKTCAVLTAVEGQAAEIAHGVDASADHEQGAGDQGLMFGFACDESPELMPLPISLAHALTRALAAARRGALPWLRPDGKSQVTVQYENGRPVFIHTVVLSAHHSPDISLEEVRRTLLEQVIHHVLPAQLLRKETRYLVNPAGSFIQGGPAADTGLTGRKIIVDTYGGMGRHGGGAFSGKDPSKVDRSAAYLARFIAKNIVAAKLAPRCEVQLAYAIGHAAPVSVYVDTFGQSTIDPRRISSAVQKIFRMKPAEVIEDLQLLEPMYRSRAAYGHFGHAERAWERTDKVEALKAEVAR